MDEESTDVFYEIENPPSQWWSDLNFRMKALLEATIYIERDPNSDNHHTALRIDDDDYYEADADAADDHKYNYLIDAALYSSAKQDNGLAFLDVVEQVSKSKKMSVRSIFNCVSLSGDTLLHLAASYGNAEIVDLIITHFPTLLNNQNHSGDTTLHVVAKAGEISVLQIIKRKRKEFTTSHSTIYCRLAGREVAWKDESLNMMNGQGNTPLHEALINGHENVAVELVVEDQKPAYSLNNENKTAFYLAAEAGHTHCLQLMMKYGPINQKEMGKTPIHAAIWGKHTDALEIMLKKQPRLIHSRDGEGRTPLHFAAWMGYNDGVDYLIEKSSRNVIERDTDGQLPIHLASVNGHIDVIEQLLKQHYNPHELLNRKGQNILHVAAECGTYKVVIYVLKHPQELNQLINQKDHDGNTPLHLATMSFQAKIVSALTWDERVDLHLSNNKDLTALDAAESNIDRMPTFRQQLTWLSLIASGASRYSSSNIDKNTNKRPRSPSSVNPNSPTMNNYKDWVGTLLLVSTLIATVTFAAGFTMPGGYNNSEPDVGIATMVKYRMFQLFVFCDTLAMFTSLTVVVLLIWAQLGDISLRGTVLNLAVPLLGIALTMMSLAFIAGVYLTVSTLKWIAIGILIMALVLLIVVLVFFFALVFPFTSRRRVFRYLTFYFICVAAP